MEWQLRVLVWFNIDALLLLESSFSVLYCNLLQRQKRLQTSKPQQLEAVRKEVSEESTPTQ